MMTSPTNAVSSKMMMMKDLKALQITKAVVSQADEADGTAWTGTIDHTDFQVNENMGIVQCRPARRTV